MELKPGYKLTEVGVIPNDWDVTKVGDVCGFIVPGRNKPKLFDGDIPWITTPDLEDGKTVRQSRIGLCISREEAKSVGSKVVPPGAVLMSCAGELGIVAFTQNEIVVNQQLHVFIPSPRVDGTFLLNAIASRRKQIESVGTKTAVPYLNKGNCNSIPIPLPPIAEQRAIAGALSDVDALIGALDQLLAKKRDLKQAAMQQLLTGHQRLPGFAPANPRFQQTDAGLIPEDWVPMKLGDGCSLFSGHHVLAGYCNAKGIGTAYLTGPSDFPNGVIQHSKFTERPTTICRKNDILISVKGSGAGTLVLADGEYCISRQLMAIRVLDWDVRYVLFSLLRGSSQIGAAASGLIPGLSRPEVLNTPVLIPSRAEQTAIAEVLSDMDAELAALEQKRDKTRLLKQGMMQELLTGRTRLI